MTIQPALKTADFVSVYEEIMALYSPSPQSLKGDNNSMRRARLSRQLEGLLKEDAYQTYICYALIASLQDNYEKAFTNFNKAIRINSTSHTAYSNFSLCLVLLNMPSKSLDYALSALERAPDSTDCRRAVLSILNGTGQFREALRVLEDSRKLKDADLLWRLEFAQQAVEFLEKFDISEDDTQKVQKVTWDILAKHHSTNSSLKLDLEEDADSSYLHLQYSTNKSDDIVLDMNLQHAEALVMEDISPKINSKLIITFS